MRFLYQVVHSIYSLFLKQNGSSSSGATVIVEDLVKNSCSGRYLISHSYLNLTCEDYQIPKALKECLQSTHCYTKWYPKF